METQCRTRTGGEKFPGPGSNGGLPLLGFPEFRPGLYHGRVAKLGIGYGHENVQREQAFVGDTLHYQVLAGTTKSVSYKNYSSYMIYYGFYSCYAANCWTTDQTMIDLGGIPGSIEYFNSMDANTIVQPKKFALAPRKTANGATVMAPFYMDKFEVTQKDYMSIMLEYPFNWPGDVQLPAEGMIMYDAILYCNKRSMRENLPPVYSYGTPVYDAGSNCTQLPNLVADKKKNGYRLPTKESGTTPSGPGRRRIFIGETPERRTPNYMDGPAKIRECSLIPSAKKFRTLGVFTICSEM